MPTRRPGLQARGAALLQPLDDGVCGRARRRAATWMLRRPPVPLHAALAVNGPHDLGFSQQRNSLARTDGSFSGLPHCHVTEPGDVTILVSAAHVSGCCGEHGVAREAEVVSNRRIGERVFVGATELTWKPVVNTGAGPGGAQRALLMSLSVTGAGLFGPTYPWVRVNDMMIIGFNNARAVVDVRRVSPTDDADLRYY